ncbi:uncharacterized protein ARMOST_11550 [Armillaria ostoyae]|uniref:Uncharacterized protein n=1 Tax=Armillaria ostoyae TaxID=47428 RepID=A0A284RHI7_ARMOS|nr:uncharacterized protein ARMOST_11550 [Armillaria ostoyae]
MQGIVQNGGGGRERLPPTRLADNGMKLEIGPLLYTSYSYSDQKFHGQVKENQPELTPAPTPSYAPIRCHRQSHRRTVFPPNSSKPPVIPSLALPLPSAPYIGTVDVASPSKIMIPSPPGATHDDAIGIATYKADSAPAPSSSTKPKFAISVKNMIRSSLECPLSSLPFLGNPSSVHHVLMGISIEELPKKGSSAVDILLLGAADCKACQARETSTWTIRFKVSLSELSNRTNKQNVPVVLQYAFLTFVRCARFGSSHYDEAILLVSHLNLLRRSSITSGTTKTPVPSSTDCSTSAPAYTFFHTIELKYVPRAVLPKYPPHDPIPIFAAKPSYAPPRYAGIPLSVVPALPRVQLHGLTSLDLSHLRFRRDALTTMHGTLFHTSVVDFLIHRRERISVFHIHLCACGVEVIDIQIRETGIDEILQSRRLWQDICARCKASTSCFAEALSAVKSMLFGYVPIRGCIVSSSMEEERHEKGARETRADGADV